MVARINWPAVAAIASAVAAGASALAAWAALAITRRQRRWEWLRMMDQQLLTLHQAVADVEATLASNATHHVRQQAQLRLRGLAQVSPLALTATVALIDAPANQLTEAMTTAAIVEIEQGRQRLWLEEGKRFIIEGAIRPS